MLLSPWFFAMEGRQNSSFSLLFTKKSKDIEGCILQSKLKLREVGWSNIATQEIELSWKERWHYYRKTTYKKFYHCQKVFPDFLHHRKFKNINYEMQTCRGRKNRTKTKLRWKYTIYFFWTQDGDREGNNWEMKWMYPKSIHNYAWWQWWNYTHSPFSTRARVQF